jgi:2-(1,2-epoxy-1,2-dihydrophenyl)acetyl-CoA isomerase
MPNLVSVARENATIQIMINRPERRNALDLATLTELAARVTEAGRDRDAHVIVVHGAGSGFCAGADLEMLTGLAERADAVEAMQPAVEALQQTIHGLATAPKVTIAAMHGFALGAGLDLALACDLRIAASGTQLACSHVHHGLIPDGGATWSLPRLIGLGPAMAMLLSGDPMDAEGAYRLGLLHRRVPHGTHLQEAMRWAEELSHRSLAAQAAVKRLARIDPRLTLSAALKEEWESQRRLLEDGEPFRFLPPVAEKV